MILALIVTGLLSFIAFGLLGETKSKAIAWIRLTVVLVAVLCAISAGVLLMFEEPWVYHPAQGTAGGWRAKTLVSVLNILMELGPIGFGLVLIGAGIMLARIVPTLWREVKRY